MYLKALLILPLLVSPLAMAELELPPEPDMSTEEVNELIDSAPLSDAQKEKIQNMYTLSMDARNSAKEGGAVSLTESVRCKKQAFDEQVKTRGLPTNVNALIEFVSDLSGVTCE